MNVRILGCSGAVSKGEGTTALLVDDDILIDAGTGVAMLDDAQMARIRHVFLTHAHLDHMAYLPLMIDAAAETRDGPLIVHAARATLDILRAHILNNLVWPDFTRIPSPEQPGVRLEAFETGEQAVIDGRTITALPARHSVPACGFAIGNEHACLAFSGDTTTNPAFWRAVAALPSLRHVIVETAFPDAMLATAQAAAHYCPSLIARDLQGVTLNAELLISHLKPPYGKQVLDELRAALPNVPLRALRSGEVLTL
jgi:ribonuclease BN (tRNA processing enzyme)